MRREWKARAGWAVAAGVLGLGAAPVAAAPAPDAARDLAEALAFDEVETASADPAPIVEPGEASATAEPASELVDRFARWVTASGDHGGRPFAIIDKVRARVFVYDANGRVSGSAPALLGSAAGDESTPGVGELALASIPPDQRTTPAGRFEAAFGPAEGAFPEVLWIDYDTALSLHPVITSNPGQRRLQRLSSETPLDNRITFGCVNVPSAFYDEVIRPTFTDRALIYVLPEARELEDVFPRFRADGAGTPLIAAASASEPQAPRLRGKVAGGEDPRRPRDDALD